MKVKCNKDTVIYKDGFTPFNIVCGVEYDLDEKFVRGFKERGLVDIEEEKTKVAKKPKEKFKTKRKIVKPDELEVK